MQFSTNYVKEDFFFQNEFRDFCFVKSLHCSTLGMSDCKVCLIPSLAKVLQTLRVVY